MAVYGTARFTVSDDGLDRAVQAIREFVAHVRVSEPGTKLYQSLHGTRSLRAVLAHRW